MRLVRHNKVELAVHELRTGDGPRLMLLHGLGEQTPAAAPRHVAAAWPGPIFGLDLTGHGASTVPTGGGYFCEVLMADVDVALGEVGPSTVLGRGLGAYLALLVAGARPESVRGAILGDGPGLAGGGPEPISPTVLAIDPAVIGSVPDPFAMVELTRDVRPPDYASSFARQALSLSPLPEPITVAAVARPAWLAAVADEPGVIESSVEDALRAYSSAAG